MLPRTQGVKMSNFNFLFCSFIFLQMWSFLVVAAEDDSSSEVKIEVVFKPMECSKKSKRGDLMNVHYDGYLAKDGTQFYCSRSDKAGHPQWFVLGVGQVIKGLDQGMNDMCPGEKRKITVPPSLGFGKEGKDPVVPPNATLVFEVELYSVSKGPRNMEAFREIDLDQDKSLTKEEVKRYLKLDYERSGTPKDDAFYDKIMEDIFKKNDLDVNGLITSKEYNVYQHDEL
ncbi:peptidyl-prolyl cis-trans isomerase FKBP7 isoform X1 [Gadus macrocephalus]|uniref:peptidyl-prolyl cis-trans isomerase FKBP7 isoform X1 n=1 Tax=Gadus macrocephalus TaxID=80720 RepID=UPI0028CB9578|nr:peptidyl-prolyl cis-trans isomerase FKBP7 isoform X1 [Gadus macrocephalus]